MRESLEQREVCQSGDEAARHDDLLAPNRVREPAEYDEERRPDDERQRDQQIGCFVTDLERDNQKEQRVELPRIPDDALTGGGSDEREQDDLQVAPIGEALRERRFGRLTLALDLLENRRFLKPQPDVDGEHQ